MKKPAKLRINLDDRPELWQIIQFDLGDGDVFEHRVKYHILTRDELNERRSEEISELLESTRKLSRAAEDSDDPKAQMRQQTEALERILQGLSPERSAERLAELQARVLAWDLEGPDGVYPCTPEYVAKACEYEQLFVGLNRGLLAASGDARAKN